VQFDRSSYFPDSKKICKEYVIDGKSLKLEIRFCPSITEVNGIEAPIILKILIAVYINRGIVAEIFAKEAHKKWGLTANWFIR